MRIDIAEVGPDDLAARADALSDMLVEVVADGAAVGFMAPLAAADARRFWITDVRDSLRSGARRLYVTEDEGVIIGAVQLILAMPPNQPHRAEIAKMMVRPGFRRRGVGRRLIDHALAEAGGTGRTLVTLDTRTGDLAEPLYRAAGFEPAGVIPDFAWDPDGRALHSTTYMFRRLTETSHGPD